MKKTILWTVIGILVTGMVVAFVEFIGHQVYPLPEGVEPYNPESMTEYMKVIPLGAMLFVLAGWFIGAFTGTTIAVIFAGENGCRIALIIGIVFLAASIFTMISIPTPIWFWIAGLLMCPSGAYAGSQLALSLNSKQT
ncbi:MAG: hypothetical protein H8D46_03185 [FCB group bacterium]|nr:hypothetical protein [FCB group bacterium]